MTATIDILVATYNGEKYIAEQIESIQAQTFEDWRLLVSDDCSTDGTLAVVEAIAAEDLRVQIVSRGVRYGGAKENFMSLLEKTEAPYVMFCDQDDVWLPKKVELTLNKMRELEARHGISKPLLVFSDMTVVDKRLNIIDGSFEHYLSIDSNRTSFRQLLAQSIGAGCSMMINEAIVRLCNNTSGYVESIIMHDWWVCLIAAAFGEIGHVESATILYRQHELNSIGAKKYSPFSRIIKIKEMESGILATFRQAEAFRACFSSELDPARSKVISEYISISHSNNRFERLTHLFASACWKHGMRKMGQIAVALLMK